MTNQPSQSVFRQVFVAAILVSVGFLFGVHAARHQPSQAVVTITDSGGNVLTSAQFAILMDLQGQAQRPGAGGLRRDHRQAAG